MTTTDIILRINDAIRTSDQDDLYDLYAHVIYMAEEDRECEAWMALIESVSDTIGGNIA